MVGKGYKFELDDEEYETLNNWWNENFKNKYFGAIGGGLSFHIIPTSLGEIVTVECNGKKLTIRDI